MPSTAAIRPTLAIHPSDFHPNAEGHALLARRLAGALWPLAELGPLREPTPGPDRLQTEMHPAGVKSPFARRRKR